MSWSKMLVVKIAPHGYLVYQEVWEAHVLGGFPIVCHERGYVILDS